MMRRDARVTCLILILLGGSAVSAGAQAPPQPPAGAAATATIAGKVTDKSSGEPVIEAGVEVVELGTKGKTDIDGKYALKVPPGRYQVRIFAPLFQGVRLQNVVATPEKVATVNAALTAAQAGVDVVEVVAQADKAAEATQLIQRRKSAVVSETVSAETIKKSPDSDAAEVVQRVPAVTVKDNKFIFVRGLGERYSSALLNGSRLPSTDPDRRVVPLDLFPADFLESLSVTKTYTPDLPGDFSGGLADIHLREFPEKLEYGLGVSAGGNDQTTFKKFKTYQGGSLDYVGIGGSIRNIPARVPAGVPNGLDPSIRASLGRSFKNIWQPEDEDALPNTGLNFSVGNSFGPLGVSFAGLYTTEYKQRTQLERQFKNAGSLDRPEATLTDRFRYDISEFETRIGGIFTSAYKLGDSSKITFRSLIDRNTTDETRVGSGQTEQLDINKSLETQTALHYTEEQLAYAQLAGEHRWTYLWLDWRSAFSQTMQDIPDTRYITYETIDPKLSPLAFTNDSLGGLRTYSALDEVLSDNAIDFTVPFKTALPFTDFWSGLPAKIKFGPAWSNRDRDFEMRRFRYRVSGTVDPTLPPEGYLAPQNIGAGGVDFVEETQPRDNFRASQRIFGGYGMIELPLIADRLRIVGGTRFEDSHIRLATADDQGNPVHPILDNQDWLPGVNLIYSPREDMNFRLGYSRSVSRPEFRELSPTQFPAPRGLRPIIGNPNLVESRIKNYDARWEWFFSPLELVSLSYFHKDLAQPIEQVVIPQASNIADSFQNAENAVIDGFEFEGRKDFGFIGKPLKNLSLLANVAYIDATVNVPIAKIGGVQTQQTSTKRTLQGQSPYVVNAALDYTHPDAGSIRLLFNRADARITAAGTFGLPDIFEEPRNQVDLVGIFPVKIFGVPLTAKLAGENLLNDEVLFTQGGRLQSQYRTGIKISFGLSYKH
jgi:hypothetical protein